MIGHFKCYNDVGYFDIVITNVVIYYDVVRHFC